ncbi:MAG: Type IV pilus biogenesis protein PilC [candidate division WWE3 bacterium GW2011_GWC1_47_10]|uniref:Type IV pilus biogenesis protein PilC n=1 Tax=candidate division WWE3 bacterium GW2011_GWC1_47_10 TaxID=1619122 RepID=A0A0G1T6F4_UNCKA|nr:MAG: Type IV pilus biogenesis protein PilC [candidate division WWE3 bacterium GW2011_GWC1_47_10]
MPVFAYKARDNFGKQRAGTVDAKSQPSAVALLKEQGLFVISLEEQRSPVFDKLLNLRGVPETEVVTFTRQLSTMVSSGLPISRALEVLADQTTDRNMRKMMLEILRAVEGGSSLSDAFGKYGAVFSATYRSLVKAGEGSGKLDVILNRLADTLEAQRELKSSFRSAMIYPAIVFVAMVFVSGYWYILLLLIGFAVVGFRIVSQSETGRDYITRLVFALPVFGRINRQKEITEFAGTLSLLVASAIPIVEALTIVSKVVQEPVFRRGILESAKYVERGNSLSEYMKSNKAFPPLLVSMASVGEETGQLDAALQRVADYFAGETARSVKGLSSALEPIILIILGGMVGLLIVSIITPIYKITNSIS